jgi:predicted transcriptional regulator
MPNWELISFIQASKVRFRIMISLNEQVKSPVALKKELKVPISRISAILKELRGKELIENMTPDRRKSKIFQLTKKGRDVLNEIHEITS